MFQLSAKLEDIGLSIDALDLAIRETMRTAVAQVATAAQAEWVRLAQMRLKTSRADYINGLRQAESFKSVIVDGEPVYTITLVGKMPNNYEFGMPSFDMKAVRPGWLGGGKVRLTSTGKRYVVIPFRHSTSSNTNLAYTGKAAAQDMQSKLRAAMSKGVSIPTGSSVSMAKMQRTSSGDVTPGKVAKIPNNADVHRYLQGMVRMQEAQQGRLQNGKQRGSSQLLTFRIMSEDSAPDSWIHPGLPGVHLLAEVESFVDRQMNTLLASVLRALT
jgi:hypothetical protein